MLWLSWFLESDVVDKQAKVRSVARDWNEMYILRYGEFYRKLVVSILTTKLMARY
jgi:hypothetical protein